MSDHLNVPQLRQTAHETQKWLNDLAAREPFENAEQAYSMLRAVLHAVRDRLTAEEAAHFSAQLPMLVRGFYFEGWRPALAPNDFDTQAEFLDRVDASLGGTQTEASVDLRAGTTTTLAFLRDRVDEGQMRHVLEQLPEQVRALMPAPASA
ncbi:MAG TPA: DUF2267 domain-containing protein [Longimicrobiales bacterium]|nr:DUF2267 domain-containing protein [Longimicrobiales bacterium]